MAEYCSFRKCARKKFNLSEVSTCISAQGCSYRSSRTIVVITLFDIDLEIIKIMTKGVDIFFNIRNA